MQFYTSRQKLTLKGDRNALVDNVTLAAAGVVDGGELEIKDLGPQASWTTVFVVEYVCDCPFFIPSTHGAWFLDGPTHHASVVLPLPKGFLRWSSST